MRSRALDQPDKGDTAGSCDSTASCGYGNLRKRAGEERAFNPIASSVKQSLSACKPLKAAAAAAVQGWRSNRATFHRRLCIKVQDLEPEDLPHDFVQTLALNVLHSTGGRLALGSTACRRGCVIITLDLVDLDPHLAALQHSQQRQRIQGQHNHSGGPSGDATNSAEVSSAAALSGAAVHDRVGATANGYLTAGTSAGLGAPEAPALLERLLSAIPLPLQVGNRVVVQQPAGGARPDWPQIGPGPMTLEWTGPETGWRVVPQDEARSQQQLKQQEVEPRRNGMDGGQSESGPECGGCTRAGGSAGAICETRQPAAQGPGDVVSAGGSGRALVAAAAAEIPRVPRRQDRPQQGQEQPLPPQPLRSSPLGRAPEPTSAPLSGSADGAVAGAATGALGPEEDRSSTGQEHSRAPQAPGAWRPGVAPSTHRSSPTPLPAPRQPAQPMSTSSPCPDLGAGGPPQLDTAAATNVRYLQPALTRAPQVAAATAARSSDSGAEDGVTNPITNVGVSPHLGGPSTAVQGSDVAQAAPPASGPTSAPTAARPSSIGAAFTAALIPAGTNAISGTQASQAGADVRAGSGPSPLLGPGRQKARRGLQVLSALVQKVNRGARRTAVQAGRSPRVESRSVPHPAAVQLGAAAHGDSAEGATRSIAASAAAIPGAACPIRGSRSRSYPLDGADNSSEPGPVSAPRSTAGVNTDGADPPCRAANTAFNVVQRPCGACDALPGRAVRTGPGGRGCRPAAAEEGFLDDDDDLQPLWAAPRGYPQHRVADAVASAASPGMAAAVGAAVPAGAVSVHTTIAASLMTTTPSSSSSPDPRWALSPLDLELREALQSLVQEYDRSVKPPPGGAGADDASASASGDGSGPRSSAGWPHHDGLEVRPSNSSPSFPIASGSPQWGAGRPDSCRSACDATARRGARGVTEAGSKAQRSAGVFGDGEDNGGPAELRRFQLSERGADGGALTSSSGLTYSAPMLMSISQPSTPNSRAGWRALDGGLSASTASMARSMSAAAVAAAPGAGVASAPPQPQPQPQPQPPQQQQQPEAAGLRGMYDMRQRRPTGASGGSGGVDMVTAGLYGSITAGYKSFHSVSRLRRRRRWASLVSSGNALDGLSSAEGMSTSQPSRLSSTCCAKTVDLLSNAAADESPVPDSAGGGNTGSSVEAGSEAAAATGAAAAAAPSPEWPFNPALLKRVSSGSLERAARLAASGEEHDPDSGPVAASGDAEYVAAGSQRRMSATTGGTAGVVLPLRSLLLRSHWSAGTAGTLLRRRRAGEEQASGARLPQFGSGRSVTLGRRLPLAAAGTGAGADVGSGGVASPPVTLGGTQRRLRSPREPAPAIGRPAAPPLPLSQAPADASPSAGVVAQDIPAVRQVIAAEGSTDQVAVPAGDTRLPAALPPLSGQDYSLPAVTANAAAVIISEPDPSEAWAALPAPPCLHPVAFVPPCSPAASVTLSVHGLPAAWAILPSPLWARASLSVSQRRPGAGPPGPSGSFGERAWGSGAESAAGSRRGSASLVAAAEGGLEVAVRCFGRYLPVSWAWSIVRGGPQGTAPAGGAGRAAGNPTATAGPGMGAGAAPRVPVMSGTVAAVAMATATLELSVTGVCSQGLLVVEIWYAGSFYASLPAVSAHDPRLVAELRGRRPPAPGAAPPAPAPPAGRAAGTAPDGIGSGDRPWEEPLPHDVLYDLGMWLQYTAAVAPLTSAPISGASQRRGPAAVLEQAAAAVEAAALPDQDPQGPSSYHRRGGTAGRGTVSQGAYDTAAAPSLMATSLPGPALTAAPAGTVPASGGAEVAELEGPTPTPLAAEAQAPEGLEAFDGSRAADTEAAVAPLTVAAAPTTGLHREGAPAAPSDTPPSSFKPLPPLPPLIRNACGVARSRSSTAALPPSPPVAPPMVPDPGAMGAPVSMEEPFLESIMDPGHSQDTFATSLFSDTILPNGLVRLPQSFTAYGISGTAALRSTPSVQALAPPTGLVSVPSVGSGGSGAVQGYLSAALQPRHLGAPHQPQPLQPQPPSQPPPRLRMTLAREGLGSGGWPLTTEMSLTSPYTTTNAAAGAAAAAASRLRIFQDSAVDMTVPILPGSLDLGSVVSALQRNPVYGQSMQDLAVGLLAWLCQAGRPVAAAAVLQGLLRHRGMAFADVWREVRLLSGYGGMSLLHLAVQSGATAMLTAVAGWAEAHGWALGWDEPCTTGVAPLHVAASYVMADPSAGPEPPGAAIPADGSAHGGGSVDAGPEAVGSSQGGEGGQVDEAGLETLVWILQRFADARVAWASARDAFGSTPAAILAYHLTTMDAAAAARVTAALAPWVGPPGQWQLPGAATVPPEAATVQLEESVLWPLSGGEALPAGRGPAGSAGNPAVEARPAGAAAMDRARQDQHIRVPDNAPSGASRLLRAALENARRRVAAAVAATAARMEAVPSGGAWDSIERQRPGTAADRVPSEQDRTLLLLAAVALVWLLCCVVGGW